MRRTLDDADLSSMTDFPRRLTGGMAEHASKTRWGRRRHGLNLFVVQIVRALPVFPNRPQIQATRLLEAGATC